MNRHGSPRVFLKSTGTPSWKRMFKFNASNYLVGIEVRSLKHHRIPPLNRCSVQRELRFCWKRTQKVESPDPGVPAIIHVNGCLNLISVLIALDEMTLSPRNLLIYTQTLRTYYRLDDADWKRILGFCHYRYTRTIAPLSFDIFIRANRDDVVGTHG